ncbi:hypothetical protein [Glaciimonas soli]|uniref:ShlB/FhaC/HecB family hemolysin secretion/activation protein n=1 Tax=Glaciimonas soli TaxID=2590999 RepID=A0A843YNB9_9BURK|nr:hypothetical protein [Glaciimonas soli]MQR00965.1 hypothetical protein [Glaciimonas soli]
MGQRLKSKGKLVGFAKGMGMALLWASALPTSHAQTAQTTGSEELRRRNQADTLERQRQQQAPNVDLQSQALAEAADTPALPSESPCFPIQRFALEIPSQLSPAIRLAGANDFHHSVI